jgi:hypothetical protein
MTEPERDIFFLEGVDDYWSPASSAGDYEDEDDVESEADQTGDPDEGCEEVCRS